MEEEKVDIKEENFEDQSELQSPCGKSSHDKVVFSFVTKDNKNITIIKAEPEESTADAGEGSGAGPPMMLRIPSSSSSSTSTSTSTYLPTFESDSSSSFISGPKSEGSDAFIAGTTLREAVQVKKETEEHQLEEFSTDEGLQAGADHEYVKQIKKESNKGVNRQFAERNVNNRVPTEGKVASQNNSAEKTSDIIVGKNDGLKTQSSRIVFSKIDKISNMGNGSCQVVLSRINEIGNNKTGTSKLKVPDDAIMVPIQRLLGTSLCGNEKGDNSVVPANLKAEPIENSDLVSSVNEGNGQNLIHGQQACKVMTSLKTKGSSKYLTVYYNHKIEGSGVEEIRKTVTSSWSCVNDEVGGCVKTENIDTSDEMISNSQEKVDVMMKGKNSGTYSPMDVRKVPVPRDKKLVVKFSPRTKKPYEASPQYQCSYDVMKHKSNEADSSLSNFDFEDVQKNDVDEKEFSMTEVLVKRNVSKDGKVEINVIRPDEDSILETEGKNLHGKLYSTRSKSPLRTSQTFVTVNPKPGSLVLHMGQGAKRKDPEAVVGKMWNGKEWVEPENSDVPLTKKKKPNDQMPLLFADQQIPILLTGEELQELLSAQPAMTAGQLSAGHLSVLQIQSLIASEQKPAVNNLQTGEISEEMHREKHLAQVPSLVKHVLAPPGKFPDIEGTYVVVDPVVIGRNPITQSTDKPTSSMFKCIFCGKRFPQFVRFKIHMKTHLEGKPILCGECDEDFYSLNSVASHFERIHKEQIGYSCSVCKEVFELVHLSNHLLTHEKDFMNFHCGVCKEKFSSSKELTGHITCHKKQTSFRCGICLLSFRNDSKFEIHAQGHFEDSQFKCDKCDKKLKTALEFKEHMRIHEGPLPYVCEGCGKRKKSRSEYIFHLNHCDKGPHQHACRKCQMVFDLPIELKKHNDDFHSFKMCIFCGKQFVLKEALDEHMKSHDVFAHFL